MERLDQLRQCDVRAVFLVLGECCELGQIPQAWCRHLHDRLRSILHTALTIIMDCQGPAAEGMKGPGASDRVLLLGDLGPGARENVQHFMATDSIRNDPIVPAWKRLRVTVGARTRQQLVSDAEWYSSGVYNVYYRTNRIDHRLVAQCPSGEDGMLILEQWREIGGPAYSTREIQMMELLIRELAHLISEGRIIPPRDAEGTDLSNRLRDVLRLVGDGLAEKEVAAELGLSPHTVHDYVKELHRILGVQTRGELVARTYHVSRADILTPPFRGIAKSLPLNDLSIDNS